MKAAGQPGKGKKDSAGAGRHKKPKNVVVDRDADSELFLRHMAGVQDIEKKGQTAGAGAGSNEGAFFLAEMKGFADLQPEKEGGSAKKQPKKKAAASAGRQAAGPARTSSLGSTEEASVNPAAEPSAEGGEMSMHEYLNGSGDVDPSFAKAMRDVQPLSSQGREVVPANDSRVGTSSAGKTMEELLNGQLEFAVARKDEYMEGYVVGLDPRILDRLRAGAICPESSMDLHGQRVEQAFESLRVFLQRCWNRGMRCLIIVHGRGKNSPGGIGVLRDRLSVWLTQEPFKRVVLAFCTARTYHGGPGSIYVLLRKYKKKGHICWEKTPADLL